MNLLFHHFRKDFRHSRWMMLATFLVAACALWFPTVPLEDRSRQVEWLPLFRYGGWFLLFVTSGRLVQLNPPLRDTAFLRTRPVHLSTWLGSKLLTVLVMIIPLALIGCIMLLALGMNPGPLGLLLIFGEDFVVLSAVALLSMAMSARKESVNKYHASVVIWGVVAMVAWIVCVSLQEWLSRGAKVAWSYDTEYLKLSRLLMTRLVATAGILIGMAWFIRGRRHETISASVAITGLCAAAVWFLWPLNFVKTFAAAESSAPKNEWPDPAALEFSFQESKAWSLQASAPVMTRFSFGDGEYYGTTYRRINAYTRLEGLPDEWFAYPNSYQSKLSLSNETILPSTDDAWSGLSEEMALPLAGIPLKRDKKPNQMGDVTLAEFPLPTASAAMTGASLKGTFEVPLKRPVILARLPLRAGAFARIGNRHMRITLVERIADKIHYNLAIESPLILSRGGWNSEPHRRIKFLVVNTGRHEFLTLASRGGSGGSSGHYSIGVDDFTGTIGRDRMKKWNDDPIPGDWLGGAELLVVGDEYGGTFSRSFEFSDVTLSNP